METLLLMPRDFWHDAAKVTSSEFISLPLPHNLATLSVSLELRLLQHSIFGPVIHHSPGRKDVATQTVPTGATEPSRQGPEGTQMLRASWEWPMSRPPGTQTLVLRDVSCLHPCKIGFLSHFVQNSCQASQHCLPILFI